MTDEKIIEKARDFMREAFIKNPHYSFDNWHIMYDHSCTVERIARKIAESVPCDTLLVSIGALFHDIGKTHEADEKTLYQGHDSFNLLVSEKFLDSLGIDPDRLQKLKDVIQYTSEFDEMHVVKDADILAFPSDKKLYMAFVEWAHNRDMQEAIQGKIDKWKKLYFDVSKELVGDLFENMRSDFEVYQKSRESSLELRRRA